MKVEGEVTMGEQPIFSTKAHVFQIDPSTKKKWLPASSQAVNVSYYHDSGRDTYRIISVDGTKAIVNSLLMPNMVFTKTSQKFGQWSDPRANTVYGLGFASEPDCTKFVEKFKEIKELLKKSEGTTTTTTTNNNNGSGVSPVLRNSGAGSNSRNSTSSVRNSTENTEARDNDNDTAQLPQPRPSTPSYSSQPSDPGSRRNSRDSPSAPVAASPLIDQLKYENDRLKIALAQSSANAKKWEVELQTLKNNNARLTTALQESTANVEEWKKQLSSYKEESARMKKKVLEMERLGGSELLQKQLSELRDKVQELETTNRHKDDQISALQTTVDNSQSLARDKERLTERVRELERDLDAARKSEGDLRVQINNVKSQQSQDRHKVAEIHQQFTAKLSEFTAISQQLQRLGQS